MKIRLRHDLGVCEGYLNAKKGDVLEVAESSAMRYIKLGYADAVTKGNAVQVPVETAVVQEKNVETATSEVPPTPVVDDVPKPLDEGEEEDTAKPVKSTPASRRR